MGFDRKQYQKEWMRKRRKAIIADLGGACVICGTTEGLEIDHIDPKTKSFPISRVVSMSLSNPIRIAELAKCQLLCTSHHLEKTFSTAKIHGIYGYRKGCRCGTCTYAKHIQKKRYLERKKLRR